MSTNIFKMVHIIVNVAVQYCLQHSEL